MKNIISSVNLADVQKILATFSKSDRTILVIGVTAGGGYLINKTIDTVERMYNKTIDSGKNVSLGGDKGFKVTSAETNAA